MIHCPHCDAEFEPETVSADSTPTCPQCGSEVLTELADFDLSKPRGGSPADATMRLDSDEGSVSDSSLAGSSFAASGYSDSELASSDDPPSSDLPDATLQASGGDSEDEFADIAEQGIEKTMMAGVPHSPADFDLDDEEDDDDVPLLLGDEDDEDGFSPSDDPGASLDATVDFGHLANLVRDQDEGLNGDDDEATVDLGGKPGPRRRSADPPTSPDEPNLTQMVGTPGLFRGPRSDARDDATIAADSGAAGSAGADSSLDDLSSRSGSDSAGDRTESPSTHAEGGQSDRDSATLAFDSERRSDHVGTPEPLDITGLSTGNTIPRGPLEEGRGSQLLKPGESQLVGDESVRLRAFLLGLEADSDATSDDYSVELGPFAGGMGEVYGARQQSLNRVVALKRVKGTAGASASDHDKLISEAVITGQLEHPNIIPVHDLGLAADGLPFYAMKFVEGEDWEDAIKGMTEEENLSILIQVAQAIAFAHSKNVIHRDLKPGNVRLGAFGEVLVMDWGLAARMETGAEIQPAGTPIYMPPETALEYLDYAKGRVVGKRVDSSRRRVPAGKHCDIYLLGALLFKIVAGRAPHRGKSTFECLRAAAKNEIVRVKRSSELLDIAYRAMATDPDDRYPSALAFIDAIKAYQSHAQSIQIARRASRELRAAEKLREAQSADTTEIYACYSRAQHGYQNALELWRENTKAQRRLKRTLRNFAEAAYANGDFDLTLSLLDSESADDEALRADVLKDQKSRNARLAWFKTLQYATAASLFLALCFIGLSIKKGNDAFQASLRAQAEQDKADKATIEAQKQFDLATKESERAATALDNAEAAERERDEAERLASEAKKLLAKAKVDLGVAKESMAAAKQQAADAARDAADAARIARAAEKEAEEQSYLAAIGQIRSTLIDNGAYAASRKLEMVPAQVAARGADDAEWRYLTAATNWRSEAEELIDEAAAAGATLSATSPDGEWLVTVSTTKGQTRLSRYHNGEAKPDVVTTVDGATGGVALDASGRYVALAGDALRVIDLTTKKPLLANGPRQASCVAFNPTRPELMVAAGDVVLRCSLGEGSLTDFVPDPKLNEGGVTTVGYSPDGRQRFAADASGRIVLWRELGGDSLPNREVYSHSAVATGSHEVTAAALADDADGRITYGCADGVVYEVAGWWPDASAEGRALGDGSDKVRPPDARRLNDLPYLDARPTRLPATHPNRVTSIAYAKGGELILSAGDDRLLVQRTPQAPDGEEYKHERRYHSTTVLSVAAGPGATAYSSDETGRVLHWRVDVAPEQWAAEASAGVAALRFDPDGAGAGALAVADANGFVRTWADIAFPERFTEAFTGHADHRDMRAWRLGGERPQIVTAAPESREVTDAYGAQRRTAMMRVCVWGEDGLLKRSLDLGERTVLAMDAEKRVLYAACPGRKIDAADNAPVAMAYPLGGGEPTPLWTRPARVAAILPLPAGAEAAFAVGLRDGQVYLWSPSGRQELARASTRPHWRPIRSLAYDPASRRLYSGDNQGYVVAWPTRGGDPTKRRLGDDASTGVAPVERLQVAPGGELLAVQRGSDARRVVWWLDASLQTQARFVKDNIADASIDAAGKRLVLLTNGGARLKAYTRGAGGWTQTSSEPTDDQIVGVAASADGVLAWGGGVAQWRAGADALGQVATRVISRPTPVALLREGQGVAALTAIGSLDVWDRADATQSRSVDVAAVLAACPAKERGEWLLAVDDGQGGARIERLDDSGRRVAALTDVLPGVCRALATDGAGVAFAAFDDRVTFVNGGAVTTTELPEATGQPRAIAVRPDGAAFVLATAAGVPWLGVRDGAGAWKLSPLDRDDVVSAAFTPDGHRLLVGVESGRVLLVELDLTAATTRPLLSFAGHSDRVTTLQVTQPPDRPATVVSGDASGRVLVRTL